MNSKEMEVGDEHTPTIENSATVHIHDPKLYISDSSRIDKDFLELQQNPLIKMYAEVGPDTYEIISRTNPVLKAVVDLAKDICGGGQ